MHRYFFTLVEPLEHATRFTGWDVLTTLDNSGAGFFAFHRERHSGGCCEFWGRGLHVVASPLPSRATAA